MTKAACRRARITYPTIHEPDQYDRIMWRISSVNMRRVWKGRVYVHRVWLWDGDLYQMRMARAGNG